MKVDDIYIWCDPANGHVTIGADGIFTASPDDSGDVSAMAVLVISPATQGIVVEHDSIMS